MARRVQIKVCGITSLQDGLAVAEAGADAVGFVFWQGGPRSVSVEAAHRIASSLPPFVLRVGVFVDPEADELARTADAVGLDVVQLHGQESADACLGAPRRVLKALAVGPDFSLETALSYRGAAAGILLDARGEAGRPGGTGRRFDWGIARQVRPAVPFLGLAGGLTPDNVAAAIREVSPDLVDVSSGVEASPGQKDREKVRAFVDAVRSVER
jgi:phosphoribosylanthranilate isomerase